MNILASKFDSDDEDEDYVPKEGIIKLIGLMIIDKKNLKNKKEEVVDSDECLDGIGNLKKQKKEKMIDDIWAMMQEEETVRPAAKIQKTTNTPSVPTS